jgi:thymidylate kinase
MTGKNGEPTDLPPLLRAAFDTLDGAGLTWVRLRDSDAAVATPDDVDILVEPVEAGHLDALLAAAGYCRLPAAGQGTHRFYLGYDIQCDTFITLDLVTEVAFGRRLEFLTAAAPSLLARACRADGVNRLDPDDAFWHLLLHYLLNKRRIPPGGDSRLARAATVAGHAGELAAIVDELRPGDLTAPEVLNLVRRGDTRAVQSLSTSLRASWRARDKRSVWSRTVRSRLERAHLVGSTRPRTTGMSIAILGPDGAGKTTLARGLAASVPLPTRNVYMGVWREYPWDRWLRVVPGARLAARLARLTARSVQCQYHRQRGRVVLLDRSTYDATLPSPDLDWRGRVTAGVVRWLSRDPDLILILDAPAEVMYARKGEQGVPVLARDRGSYLRLAAQHGAATVIDATMPPARVRTHARQALWQALVKAST